MGSGLGLFVPGEPTTLQTQRNTGSNAFFSLGVHSPSLILSSATAAYRPRPRKTTQARAQLQGHALSCPGDGEPESLSAQQDKPDY